MSGSSSNPKGWLELGRERRERRDSRHAAAPGPAGSAGLVMLLAVMASAQSPALALDDREITYPGPYLAEVERVLDGDTVAVRAHIWPDQVVSIAVRIRGVDTPELRGQCDAEIIAARRAADFVANLVAEEDGVLFLRDVSLGKFGGRVIGRLETRLAADVGHMLLNNNLGVRYEDRNEQRQRLCPSL